MKVSLVYRWENWKTNRTRGKAFGLTLPRTLDVELGPIGFAGWCTTMARRWLRRLSRISEVRIFQIQCVATSQTRTFHSQINGDIVALPSELISVWYTCNQFIFRQTYLLLANSRTVPVSNWPCLTKSGVSSRQRTWYQWVKGSVGAVDNHTELDEPKNATSNQNANPCTKPDCSAWNSSGISKRIKWKLVKTWCGTRYYIKTHPFDEDLIRKQYESLQRVWRIWQCKFEYQMYQQWVAENIPSLQHFSGNSNRLRGSSVGTWNPKPKIVTQFDLR